MVWDKILLCLPYENILSMLVLVLNRLCAWIIRIWPWVRSYLKLAIPFGAREMSNVGTILSKHNFDMGEFPDDNLATWSRQIASNKSLTNPYKSPAFQSLQRIEINSLFHLHCQVFKQMKINVIFKKHADRTFISNSYMLVIQWTTKEVTICNAVCRKFNFEKSVVIEVTYTT